MPLSSKILRGLDIKGWKIYRPRLEITNQPVPQEDPAARRETRQEQEAIEQDRKMILQEARREAMQLYQQQAEKARQEAGALKSKACKDGYADGYRKGEEESLQLKEKANKILAAAQQKYQQILDGAEKEMMQIAINLAEKLLNYQIEVNSDCILFVISRALAALPEGQDLLLNVNPEDEKVCREREKMIKEQLKEEIHWEIKADPQIPRGSCRIETEAAEVELILQKELEILAGKLLELAAPQEAPPLT